MLRILSPEPPVLDALGIGLFHLDADHRIDFWNRAMEDLSGYPQEEVVGWQGYEMVLACIDAHGVRRCHKGCTVSAPSSAVSKAEEMLFIKHKSGHRLPVRFQFFEEDQMSGYWVSCHRAWERGMPLSLAHCERSADLFDTLTGLPNRRSAEHFLFIQERGFNELKIPYGLVLYDIDRFRHFNDAHGHLSGDEMLRVVARTLEHTVRTQDHAFRWDGEEFLVVLPGATLDEVREEAEKGKHMLDASCLSTTTGELKITVSGGVVSRREGDTLGCMLYRADEGVYQAKKHGRNQIYCID